jgi:hypothetical protein
VGIVEGIVVCQCGDFKGLDQVDEAKAGGFIGAGPGKVGFLNAIEFQCLNQTIAIK